VECPLGISGQYVTPSRGRRGDWREYLHGIDRPRCTTGIGRDPCRGAGAVLRGEAWSFGIPTSTRDRSTESDSDGSVHAPIPGRIVSVAVRHGQPVQKGQTLLTLEAMKWNSRYRRLSMVLSPVSRSLSASRSPKAPCWCALPRSCDGRPILRRLDPWDHLEHELRRTVTQTDNLLISTLTHNPQPLHLDAEAAHRASLARSWSMASLPSDS